MLEEIKKIIKGDVLIDEETLDYYSRDASLFEIRPTIVIFPKDSNDIQELVKWVSQNKDKYPGISITARAAGTCMSGGSINDSIILDLTKYMGGVIDIKEEPDSLIHGHVISGYATVLPGTFYRDFDKETRKFNLIMPSYSASREICAVGGMVSNNAGGEKSIQYGKTEDYIRELKVVFHDGYEYTINKISRKELLAKITIPGFEGEMYKELFRIINENIKTITNAKPDVSKNSAGYYLWNIWDKENDTFDLCRLIVGSQGTLGIITEIKFNLVKTKKFSTLAVVFLKDMQNLGNIVNTALTSGPESIESYDDNTLKVAIKFFGDFLKKKKFWGMLKFMISFLPELFMTISGGMPKMVLLIEFAGNDYDEIQNKAKYVAKEIKDKYKALTHVTHSEAEEQKYWDVRHESFNLLRKHVKGRHTAPFIDDFIVKPEFLPEFLPKLDSILAKYNLTYTIAGHPGDGNFHIIPLMYLTDPKTREVILSLSDEVYDLVLEYNGSITAEHNDGIIRSPYLEKQYGSTVVMLFKEVKELFDPKYIFNPHKKVGVTKDDISKYLSHGDYGQATKK